MKNNRKGQSEKTPEIRATRGGFISNLKNLFRKTEDRKRENISASRLNQIKQNEVSQK